MLDCCEIMIHLSVDDTNLHSENMTKCQVRCLSSITIHPCGLGSGHAVLKRKIISLVIINFLSRVCSVVDDQTIHNETCLQRSNERVYFFIIDRFCLLRVLVD